MCWNMVNMLEYGDDGEDLTQSQVSPEVSFPKRFPRCSPRCSQSQPGVNDDDLNFNEN